MIVFVFAYIYIKPWIVVFKFAKKVIKCQIYKKTDRVSSIVCTFKCIIVVFK